MPSDPTVFLKVSRHVVDPLFLFRPKKFTKAGSEAEKEVPTAYSWVGNTSFFTVEVQNPYSIELPIERIALRLVPLVVSQVQRGKFDIAVDPSVNCDASNETGPVCRVSLAAKSSVSLRIPVTIPKITNLPAGKSILLLPSHLDYTVFNCHFQERLDTINIVPEPISLAWALPRTLRLINRVPRLQAVELGRSWNANASAHQEQIKPKNAGETAPPSVESMEHLPGSTSDPSSALDVSSSLFPSLSQLSASVIRLEGVPQGSGSAYGSPLVQIQLMRGEEYSSVLALTNEDAEVEIEDINIDIVENGVSFQSAVSDMAQQGSSPCNIFSPHLETTFADAVVLIRRALPIKPRQTIHIPFRMLAEKFSYVVESSNPF